MRAYLKSILIAAIGVLAVATGGANAAVIGAFVDMKYNTDLLGKLTDQGHTLALKTDYSPLDAGYLSSIDVFITGVIPADPAAGEISALTDWVMAGGTAIITGEHDSFKTRYNNWLNPFGVTLEGVSYNYNNPVAFISDPSDPYLANGVAGSTFPINNRGYYTGMPADASVIATGMDGTIFGLKFDLGDGVVIAIADTYFLNNAVIGSGGNAGVDFLLNAASLARSAPVGDIVDGGGLSEVPLPGAFLLMATALGAAGVGRRRFASAVLPEEPCV